MLSIAFGPKLVTLSAVEIPTGFFVVYLVCCTPLLCGLGCRLSSGLGYSG
jgi:hypothetical protein